jgi:hypothetical protein
MKRAMAQQAEAEREKRATIIAAESEALAADALGTAADVMLAHPLALQLRNLQSLVLPRSRMRGRVHSGHTGHPPDRRGRQRA